MNKIYRNFIFDIIAAVVLLALGILLLPPFEIGEKILNIILALCLIAYLVFFLFNKLKRARGSIFILTVVEFVIVSIIALGLLLQQLQLFNISSICRTIGLVIWLRGTVVVISMYLTAYASKIERKNLPMFVLNIAIVSTGAFLFAKPLVSDLVINWIICVLLFILTVIFIGLSLLFAPEKKKKAKTEISKK